MNAVVIVVFSLFVYFGNIGRCCCCCFTANTMTFFLFSFHRILNSIFTSLFLLCHYFLFFVPSSSVFHFFSCLGCWFSECRRFTPSSFLQGGCFNSFLFQHDNSFVSGQSFLCHLFSSSQSSFTGVHIFHAWFCNHISCGVQRMPTWYQSSVELTGYPGRFFLYIQLQFHFTRKRRVIRFRNHSQQKD